MNDSDIDYRQTAASFRERRWLYVEKLVPGALLDYLKVYYQILLANNKLQKDDQCPLSLSVGGDPAFDAVLGWITPVVSSLVGFDLAPTYSYTRIYAKDDVLLRHSDRPACEISVTISIEIPKSAGPSVLHLKPPNMPETAVEMREGDACVYAGTEVEHWREPFSEDGYIQLFLHWIDKRGGNFPKWIYDKRKSLGAPYDASSAAFSRPPPYGRLSNWLGTDMLARLLNFARKSRDNFQTSSVDYGEDERIDLTYRRSSTLTKLGGLENDLLARIQAALPFMFEQLGSAPFKPARFELEMVAHGDGAFFARHHDTTTPPNGTSHRVISAVYYFHEVPKSFSGGVLRLHSIGGNGKAGSFVEIEPTNDTLIFFPSWFPHEVLSVTCPSGRFEDSRFAINCWVYRHLGIK
jgi:SM-20-related protein